MGSADIPNSSAFRDLQRLPREISAIQIWAAGEDQARMGMIVSISEGSDVELCGIGFNDRTVRICWQGNYYFAFRDDFVSEPGEQRKVQRAGTS